ncbi:MAG: histidine phosphatase family protein [Huintestinicola sp.]
MKIVFIRHGKTAGNLEKRYIGSTDEPLCDEGIAELSEMCRIMADIVISSPMKRCIQTAELLFPHLTPLVVDDLRECCFGDFEEKNYEELNGNADYQAWIDSGGEMPFPNGESKADFTKRSADAFVKTMEMLISQHGNELTAAFVVHGGTIMSVLSSFAEPERDYYDYMCKNGGGYVCNYENGKITEVTELI